MNSSFSVSFQWLPVFDKYRYKPLGIHPEFLQNVFDVLFLLVFIWYWNWGPLLVILYYVMETIVMWFFTALKIGQSKAPIKSSQNISPDAGKWIIIVTLSVVVGVFSFIQITIAHHVLSDIITLPSLQQVFFQDKEFLLGVMAIVLQQTVEYFKYKRLYKREEDELTVHILTPMIRIFIQQFSVIIGVIAVLVVSFFDVRIATVMIALILGMIKMVFGQLYFVPKEK